MKPIIIIQTITLGALALLTSCTAHTKGKDELMAADSIPVKVASVQSLQTSADILATGLVATENEATYAFKINGVISRIYVDEGQFFKKGQLLAALNSTEIGSSVDQARLATEKARRDYQRTLNLYKDSVATLEQLQNGKTSLDLARKAEYAVAFNAQYAKIYATSDGFVSRKAANEGEVILPGAPVLAVNEISGNDDYTLKVGVTARQWASIAIDQKAWVMLDGFPGDTLLANVLRKSQSADHADGAFQIELKLELKNIKPAIGMFGRARIIADKKVNAIVIPYDALIEADGNNAFVFVISANHHVKKTPIEIASFDNNQVYVKSGLDKSATIVVSNSAFLNEQSQIKIIR